MSTALKNTAHREGSRILAFGAARGDVDVVNDDLVGPIDSSDEWIRQRTGIASRKRASKELTIDMLAETAGREALEKAGIDGSQLGAIIISTISNPVQTPSLASLVGERLGAHLVPAFDISAACAGYTYGIAQADALIRSGAAEYVLVIGAEKLSEVIDPTDRSISFLLGDGAGAAVMGASDEVGVSESVWGSDGSKWDVIHMTNSLYDMRDNGAPWPTLRQEGPTVFRWAVWEMAKVAREALEKAGIGPQDLAAFVPHQANMRIIDEFAKQLKLPDSVVIARDIETTGNTSAASIPLATHQLLEDHPELSGGLSLQIGFGAGLVYGAQVIRLP
ncbi:MAG: beta-ketoacyl-ACP synthase III [Agrococcus casei]|uniref:beta-ketoacyl-ACP synthase III n=1 Tax=Agrococcus casei TaxID=343512 RepID=UPI003F90A4AC